MGITKKNYNVLNEVILFHWRCIHILRVGCIIYIIVFSLSVYIQPLVDVVLNPEDRLLQRSQEAETQGTRPGATNVYVHYTSQTIDEEVKSSFFSTTVNLINSIIGENTFVMCVVRVGRGGWVHERQCSI
jgi:hypothetical protein